MVERKKYIFFLFKFFVFEYIDSLHPSANLTDNQVKCSERALYLNELETKKKRAYHNLYKIVRWEAHRIIIVHNPAKFEGVHKGFGNIHMKTFILFSLNCRKAYLSICPLFCILRQKFTTYAREAQSVRAEEFIDTKFR